MNKEIKIVQGLTNAQLAELNNCSVDTIKKYLKKNNIKWNRYPLYEKYLVEIEKKPHISNEELSKILNCSVASIRKFNIRNNRKGTFGVKYEKFSLFEISVLVGTLFGDGWLTHSSKTKECYRGGFSHKIQNRDYVKYKRDLLLKHCNELIFKNKITKTFNDREINAQQQVYTNLKSNPFLKTMFLNLYKRFENNRFIKTIDYDTLKYFTDISLALFYQDDGSKVRNKKYENGFSYKIVMFDYDEKSVDTFIDFLFRKWNIKATKQFCKQHGYQIYIRTESRLKFKYLIKPYIVQSMLYKL